MSRVKDKKIFCSTKLQDFSSEPIGSENFYSRYEEFVRLFAKIIPNINFEEYFAEPYFNNENKNLEWYIPELGGDLTKVTDLALSNPEMYNMAQSSHQELLTTISQAKESCTANQKPFFSAVLLGLQGERAEDYCYWRDNHLVFVVWGVRAKPGRKIEMKFSDDIINRLAYRIKYTIEGKGTLSFNEIARRHNYVLQGDRDIPQVMAAERHIFKRWLPYPPQGAIITSDITFTAVCEFDGKPLISFKAGKGGYLIGSTSLFVEKNAQLSSREFPTPQPNEGYIFSQWSPNREFPIQVNDEDMEFVAHFALINEGGSTSDDKAHKDDVNFPPKPETGFVQDPLDESKQYNVKFLPGEHGSLSGRTEYTKKEGERVTSPEIPDLQDIHPDKGYRFVGWDKNPENYEVHEDTFFTALYKPIEHETEDGVLVDPTSPWSIWFGRMSGCLNWLLTLLLLGLIGLLLWFLLGNHNLNFCGCDCEEEPNVVHVEEEEENEVQDTTTTRTISACDELQYAGDNNPKSFVFDMGQTQGSFLFEYATGNNQADRIIIYDGDNRNANVIYDYYGTTGNCNLADGEKKQLHFTHQIILVDVIPDSEYGTCWEIKVHCPQN